MCVYEVDLCLGKYVKLEKCGNKAVKYQVEMHYGYLSKKNIKHISTLFIYSTILFIQLFLILSYYDKKLNNGLYNIMEIPHFFLFHKKIYKNSNK